MNFKEAMKLLKKGKKICRPEHWRKGFYWTLGYNQVIQWKDGTAAKIYVNQTLANDFEKYKEVDDWNLERECVNEIAGYSFNLDDVRKLQTKILEDVEKCALKPRHIGDKIFNENDVNEIINRRFGF